MLRFGPHLAYSSPMEHTLIETIIASIVTAFFFGLVAKSFRFPGIFGYLLAGVAIGPYSPGYVADVQLARQLAEIGITLLMFGVGLHFSLRDLMNSRKVALPGALSQIIVTTLVGYAVALGLGFNSSAAMIYGFSLSVASTIVLIRALEQQNLLRSKGGKIAVSWLVIEDIAMVLALVMIPAIAEMSAQGEAPTFDALAMLLLTPLLKIGAFFALMLVVGRRALPWLLKRMEKLQSMELSTLGTLAIALGIAAVASYVFDASLALGAFLAGVMLNETAIGRKSSKHTSQLRDTFSVLFFVSVGMLFDPRTLVNQPLAILWTFMTIVGVKMLAAVLIMRLLKQPWAATYPVAVGLAQIGEFSFILAGVTLANQLIGQDVYNLILGGAMLSIVVNPFLFRMLAKHAPTPQPKFISARELV